MSVEIIGRAVRTPAAQDVNELFQLLKDGRSVISMVHEDRWGHARFWHPVPGTPGKSYTFAAGIVDDIYDFDPSLFGLAAREAMYMDPQQRILLQLVWRALEDASLTIPMLQKDRVGVYVGASSLDTGNTYIEDPAAGGPYFMTGNTLSIIANRVSHIFGLNGPSLTIDTACSSSLVALDQAVHALQSGEIDTAIVGGVNVLAHPFSYIGFSQARMLSPEGLCRAYGENGQGYVRSEGGGVVVLRSTARALNDRSYARIVATGLNSAGRTNGISLPSREMQAELLRGVYGRNALDPNDLAFIEGHGTGTKVGDPAELWAIGTELAQKRQDELLIGSVKSNVGHSEPASGMFGLIKAMLSLQHDFLPASLHAGELNADVDFESLKVKVNRDGIVLPRGEKPRLAGINSFGFGGTNAHVVISDPEMKSGALSDATGPFMVSAHTRSALTTLLEDYRRELKSDRPDLAQMVAASAFNRTHMKYRFAVDSVEPDVVCNGIDGYLNTSAGALGHGGEAMTGEARPAFVFAGNGSQWAGMAMDAFAHDPEFAKRLTEICSAFRSRLDFDLLTLFQGQDLQAHLSDTRVGQALLFAIQASLSDVLIGRNIKPAFVFGHSVGEVAAAYCAGILSLDQAVAVVAVRSRHQHALAGEGKMAAVALSADRALELAKESGLFGIELAAINSHNSVTVSGPAEEIVAYREYARKRHVPAHVLDIDYPFHHSLIDREKNAFLLDLPPFQPAAGTIVFISSVTGTVLSGEKLDGRYWWNNVRDVVRFSDATAEAIAQGCNLFIEITPRSILSSYLSENARQSGTSVAVVPTLTRPARRDNPVPHIVAATVANGVSPWSQGEAHTRFAGVALPPLPFESETLRPPETSDGVNLFGRGRNSQSYTLLGWRTDPRAASWKNHIDANLFPDLAEHVVDGKSIIPGSAFIEMAVAAASQLFESEEVEVSNLEIVRPLELHTARLSEVSTIVSVETGQIEIRSREYLSDDDWSIHAVARIRKPVKALVERIDNSGQGGVCPREIGAQEAYGTARQFGLEYGLSFQLLQGVKVFPDRTLSVDLAPAAAPAHPYLSYRLNPISIDAAFHGLVALFTELTGELDGAPYIPVRFGSLRCRVHAGDVRSARIEILRFSPYSLKIRVELFAENGDLVAVLHDCRFKRTFLKLHHNLDTISFHYERVPVRSQASDQRLLSDILPSHDPMEPSEELLLYDAAVYRASYDIGHRTLKVLGGPDGDRLDAHPELKAYISNCLLTLEECDLAEYRSGRWVISGDADLPDFDDIIRELIGRFPGGGATAILINNNRQFVLDAIEALSRDGASASIADHAVSEATLDHFCNSLKIAQTRIDEVCRAVDAFLEKAAHGNVGSVVVEAGATSIAVSGRLAAICERFKSRLFILEDDENLRSTLKTTFSRNPWVSVVASDSALPDNIDLAVHASGFLGARMQESDVLKAGLGKIASTGAELLAAEHQHGVLANFIFGLQPGWFGQSVTLDLPVGRIPSTDGMLNLLRQVGFLETSVVSVDIAEGSLAVLSAKGRPSAVPVGEFTGNSRHITVLCDGAHFQGSAFCKPVHFDASSGVGLSGIEDALHGPRADAAGVLYVMDAFAAVEQHSLLIQNHVNALGRIAEMLRASAALDHVLRPQLVVIAPGGANLAQSASPVAQAIWSFARVLQNEYDELDVMLADISGQHLSDDIWNALLECQKLGENELFYDPSFDGFSALRVVPGPFERTDELVLDYQAASITQKSSGRIETIGWQECAVPQPAPGEVVVAVAATGLNFRDVMWSMGMLPEEALEDGFAGATIGMEFSGTVASVGAGVADIQPGDRVMGIGPGAFSTHVVVSEKGVTRVPDSMGLAEAATVPVTFLTAYYALMELGRLRSGETVLIHGAAGGVGLAALQIAKLQGATVIATAGTSEKRNLVKTLGADHIFDSRSLDFVDDIMNATQGAGVDVVINSLFQEAMERSLELVKPFGRFLELGKRDYYSDSKIGLRPFRRNISYFGIDADQLLVEAPETVSKIFLDIAKLFESNRLRPLPYRTFSHDEIASAFRLMQSAGHIGKIIVTPPAAGKHAIQARRKGVLAFSGGVYLVVGGIGGFGLEAANWIADRGASHIALATRSGVPDEETRSAIEQWKRRGVTASLHACDVTDRQALGALLEDLRGIGPLKGVVHAAMVLDDALIANLDLERNRPVIHTKVEGARLLDELTEGDELDLFLLFSSATTMVGNPGQSNYVAANGYLEGLASARRQRGKPALAVAFGAIVDAGFLARNTDVNDVLSKRIGRSAMKARDALRHVESYLNAEPDGRKTGSVVIAEIDWSAAAALPIVKKPLFATIDSQQIAQQAGAGEQLDLHAMIDGKSESDMNDMLHSLIAAELSAILQMSEANITREKVLRDIGLDSLMAMELGTSFQQKTGIDLPLSAVSDSTTVGDIVAKLRDKLHNRQVLDDGQGETLQLLSGITTRHAGPKTLADVA